LHHAHAAQATGGRGWVGRTVTICEICGLCATVRRVASGAGAQRWEIRAASVGGERWRTVADDLIDAVCILAEQLSADCGDG
jgi:hypothetical protein